MNTARGSTRRIRLTRMSAVVAAGLLTAGLAAAGTTPAHDPTIGQSPAATTTAAGDEPILHGDGNREAAPAELAVKELPKGPEIAVDGLFGPGAQHLGVVSSTSCCRGESVAQDRAGSAGPDQFWSVRG